MIAPTARPQLASKVRLRFDRHSQRHMLVYPDRGMLLNPSAARILELCTGDYDLSGILDHLQANNPSATREQLEHDVQTFLGALLARGLIRTDPESAT